jgi:enterochelin esterase-like enzyme
MSGDVKNRIACVALALLLSPMAGKAQGPGQEPPYRDLSHESKVFGHKKLYRLYLPLGYDRSAARYPVIYYFHGWGGRPYKDENARLEYEKLKQLVDKYQVILVMVDGSMDGIEPRPYNVGDHADIKFQVQMKDYFPELIAYVDSTYRTLTDRYHRGIIGFSMGGFMSLYLAGKYPDKIGAAVSLAGGPDYWVGYPDNQTWYPVRYAFLNLQDVAVRMHNGNTDILYYLNEEVHAGALWEGKPLEYWKFNGGHMVDLPGETKVFEKAVKFVMDAFHQRRPPEASWSHVDLYPDFSLWGYRVESDKREPGFISLKNVDRSGFGVYTLSWLPAGPPLDTIHIKVSTAPVYFAGKCYGLAEFSALTGAVRLSRVSADEHGRLTVTSDGAGNEFGFFDAGDKPHFVFLDYAMHSSDAMHGSDTKSGTDHYLHIGNRNKLTIRLFNRGGENALTRTLRVALSTADSAVKIADTLLTVTLRPGQRIIDLPPFRISCFKTPPPHAEPPEIKFRIRVYAGKELCKDDFIAPVWFNTPYFDSVRIDDGLAVRDSAWGKGNADGRADAGESIMVYQGSHRLRLFTDDPWVQKKNERLAAELIPARWPDGIDLSSVIRISQDCPDGHTIEFLGHYETKAFNPIERKLTWGRLSITVHHAN